MNMVNCSKKCASFCESFDSLNDVQVIFLYQNFLLQSVFYGDQSTDHPFSACSVFMSSLTVTLGYRTWHAFNDAANALLAAGLHQRAQDGHNLPLFLVEMRKHIFVRLYTTDITIATFLGRPPRLSKKFTTVDYPADIDEAILSGSALDLELELKKPTRDGWSVEGKARSGAVLRWAMITSMIREEILELLLSHATPDPDVSLLAR